MKQEIYVSVDCESDGPLPGPNSMLSLGAAAFLPNKTILGTFETNLELLPEATPDPNTMKWWETQPEAWQAHRKNLKSPTVAMKRFVEWVKALPGKPVFVGYPAGFDFLFTYVYLIRFAGESPFSFSGPDIKSYAAAVLKCPYREATKRNFPKHWFEPGQNHSHKALEDAIEQGYLFCNILADNEHGTTTNR